MQPCVSPVWDTAIATIALADASLPADHPAWGRAVDWLLDKEVRRPGDWAINGPRVEPTGWHFQFHNEFYPDLDDTAMVLLALQPIAPGRSSRRRGGQPARGRLAAGDAEPRRRLGGLRRRHRQPGPDQGPVRRPQRDARPELRRHHGARPRAARHPRLPADHPAIRRALDYLWRTQEPEGCWYGRWGVNYIYGTWQVLQGLATLDFPMDHPRLVRAVEWLESAQQPSGGWGETCRSYDDPSLKGTGDPTPSQTAWAVLGLIAAGRARTGAVRRGIDYLLAGAGTRRHLGRGDLHRHRLPPGLLPAVSLLPDLLPAHGHRALQGGHASATLVQIAAGPGQPHPGAAGVAGSLNLRAVRLDRSTRQPAGHPRHADPLRRPAPDRSRTIAATGPRDLVPRRPSPMRFPLPMTTRIAGYVAKKRLVERAEKFPMVLMLEPLHACNLTCTGCGRIREYESTIKQKLTSRSAWRPSTSAAPRSSRSAAASR